ncbi:TPA: hypothetical protein SMN98_005599 [Pseudomonas aeruginosa]|uniref:hypothetical protein n=1 Tax=Pseudomonas aeruginosa TaxID=287 RepID=UPI00053E559F|nr:hypothetical protein [Pseudomonas aeruginosa]MCG0483804.1 hypothetical protein [Pseudomonas aeruginosa]TJY45340.1 hypothetical protein FCG96_28960 [Pseudomonas aeruginosa]HBO0992266.1 hypothetical protein [Pseudomonas aeruginosa]HBO1224286.1 hypothetical protein [Pseudomonas aeruginosa]HBO1242586.1 hypothetical protein [Pseudomonas aeruginosa]
MNRKQFRKARLAVYRDMIAGPRYGHSAHVPGYKSALYLHLTARYDRLQARHSEFTPDARRRIALYPLIDPPAQSV